MNEIVQVRMNNWASLIKARQSSGQTVKEWCADNDVSINAYYYWLRKLRKAAIDLAKDPLENPAQFVRIPATLTQGNICPSMRITHGDMLIEVSNDASDQLLSFLKEVIFTC